MFSDTAIVICSYVGDDPALTLSTLKSAAAQGAAEVLLVDMCDDNRLVRPASAVGSVRPIHFPVSSGLGESRQRGLAETDARYIAFLDSDAKPRESWLESLRSAVSPDGVAVAGGPVLPVWPSGRIPTLFKTQVAGDFLSMLDLGSKRLDVPRVLPGNMIVDRTLTGEGVFSTERGRTPTSLVGAEEIEMMERMRKAGRRIVYEPRAAVDHHSHAERMNWRWMFHRLEAAGRESVENPADLPPIPRQLKLSDRIFQMVAVVPFLLGRLRARRR